MSAFLPSGYCVNMKIIKIWDERKKVVVEIQKSLCGGQKTENLINFTSIKSTYFVQIFVESACFAMKIIRN